MGTTHDQDEVSRRARAQQVALFRYQLICPALEAGLSTKARGRVVRAIAARAHRGLFGGHHCYSRDTLDRWIRRYRAGGFDALTPSLRQPGTRIDTGCWSWRWRSSGRTRTAPPRRSPGFCGPPVAIRRRSPRCCGCFTAVSRWAPPPAPPGVRPVRGPDTERALGRRRAARPHSVAEKRTSSLFWTIILGSRWATGSAFAEDTVRLAAALEPALAAAASRRPYVDNGSAFVDPGCCGPAPNSGSG